MPCFCFNHQAVLDWEGKVDYFLKFLARVAELVDALALGASAFGVGVRLPPLAPADIDSGELSPEFLVYRYYLDNV